MITVEEAKRVILDSATLTATAAAPLAEAGGRYLAERVIAPYDHPLFDMSAVDGYALLHDTDVSEWRIVGSIQAGEALNADVRHGECVRIFTGAMIPAGADTVVMQEFVIRDGDRMTHNDTRLKRGANVRHRGEQVQAGDVLLETSMRLSPAGIGLLASAGVTHVHVHVTPRVNIVRTGGEFVDGNSLIPGRIFSSNDVMLRSALRTIGIEPPAGTFTPKDDPLELRDALRTASDCDVLLTTGGVSVGDHDLIRKALEGLGAEILFHGVKQKPGKPMLFARLGHTHVFALPGNPRAVLVAWYTYVAPFIRAIQGVSHPWLRSERLPLATSVRFNGERAEFRAAQVRDGMVHLLPDEGSHMLTSLTVADALAYFPYDPREAGVWTDVEVLYLPSA